MAYHCLKFNDDEKLIKQCPQLINDGHCFYCPFCHSFDEVKPASTETINKVLEKIIETANIALRKEQ